MKARILFLFILYILLTAFRSHAQLLAQPVTDQRLLQSLNINETWVMLSSESLKINGPNCWNFVSYSLGYTNNLRHTSASEFDFQIKKHCVEINQEDARKGDVIRIINPRTGEDVHTTRFLTPLHSFGKHTYDSSTNSISQYGVYSLLDILKDYGTDHKYCNESSDLEFKCQNIVKYYSCKSRNNTPLTNLDDLYFPLFNAFFKEYLFHPEINKYQLVVKRNFPELFNALSTDLLNLKEDLNLDNFKITSNEAIELIEVTKSYQDQMSYFYNFLGYRNSRTLKEKDLKERFKTLLSFLEQRALKD